MSVITSIRNLISQSVQSITDFLSSRNCELKKTQFEETYIVKFTEKANVTDLEVNPLRGLIFNSKTGQIISMTYPVPIEFKDLSPEAQAEALVKISGQAYHVHDAFDGTLLRYSYFSEQKQWLLSTNSKEDATQAFWMNGVSFHKQFDEACKLDTAKLDTNHVHLFALCHPLNQIVVPHDQPHVYHMTTYDRTQVIEIDCDLGMPKLPKYDMNLAQVAVTTAEASEKPVKSAGYLVSFTDPETQWTTRYRFENANYTQAKKLRGSSNNIEFTLLGLMCGEPDQLSLFLQYFPNYIMTCDALRERMTRLTAKFYRDYGARYKDHSDVHVHPRHHKFLGEIHQKLYRDTLKPINQTVQYADIAKFLAMQPPAKILYMLNYIYPDPPKQNFKVELDNSDLVIESIHPDNLGTELNNHESSKDKSTSSDETPQASE
jgi:hypothetical protein